MEIRDDDTISLLLMSQTTKEDSYAEVLAELEEAFKETSDLTARMAAMVGALHNKFSHYFWTGFYTVIDGELTLGPFQGPPACLVLEKHKGVCWAGIDREEPVVVPNVHEFPDHIACDGRANSEVVIPIRDESGTIIGVLDVDSADFDAFDEVDVENLKMILKLVFP